MSELNDFQKWCKEILPVVQAGADGEDIEYFSGGEWRKKTHYCMVNNKETYRIKPRTIKVNGFDVKEPMREAPAIGSGYFTASIEDERTHGNPSWNNDKFDKVFLSRGICHATKEAAIAHAKAMLGINPN